MKKSLIKNLIVVLLIISSIVLLSLKIIKNVNKKEIEEKLLVFTNEEFDLNNFLNNTSFSKNDFTLDSGYYKRTVLFYINSDDCNPCMKNLRRISEIVKINKKEFSANQIIVIKDINIKRAYWFSKTIKLNVPMLFGFDSNYVKKFEKTVLSEKERQILLIENGKNKIIARMKLIRNNLISDEMFKEFISINN
ncbi:MAG: hypothetical protein AB1432_08040 [Bacteroidota bacterium]